MCLNGERGEFDTITGYVKEILRQKNAEQSCERTPLFAIWTPYYAELSTMNYGQAELSSMNHRMDLMYHSFQADLSTMNRRLDSMYLVPSGSQHDEQAMDLIRGSAIRAALTRNWMFCYSALAGQLSSRIRQMSFSSSHPINIKEKRAVVNLK